MLIDDHPEACQAIGFEVARLGARITDVDHFRARAKTGGEGVDDLANQLAVAARGQVGQLPVVDLDRYHLHLAVFSPTRRQGWLLLEPVVQCVFPVLRAVALDRGHRLVANLIAGSRAVHGSLGIVWVVDREPGLDELVHGLSSDRFRVFGAY